MCYYIDKYSNSDFESFTKFIIETEKLFNPPISERMDLQDYINKLIEESQILLAKSTADNLIVGTAAYYCTPKLYDYAFLSYIATNVKIKGIGSELVKIMINHCKNEKAKGIETQTWEGNIKSIALFQKFNFKRVGVENNRDNKINSIILRLNF